MARSRQQQNVPADAFFLLPRTESPKRINTGYFKAAMVCNHQIVIFLRRIEISARSILHYNLWLCRPRLASNVACIFGRTNHIGADHCRCPRDIEITRKLRESVDARPKPLRCLARFRLRPTHRHAASPGQPVLASQLPRTSRTL